jgi:hypothetical protein
MTACISDYSEPRVQNPRPTFLRRSDDGAYLREARDRNYLPDRAAGDLGTTEGEAEVHVRNLPNTCFPRVSNS